MPKFSPYVVLQQYWPTDYTLLQTPQDHLGWKDPLEVIYSKLLLQAGQNRPGSSESHAIHF